MAIKSVVLPFLAGSALTGAVAYLVSRRTGRGPVKRFFGERDPLGVSPALAEALERVPSSSDARSEAEAIARVGAWLDSDSEAPAKSSFGAETFDEGNPASDVDNSLPVAKSELEELEPDSYELPRGAAER